MYRLHGLFNQFGSGLGSFGTSSGKAANLLRHHCEALACLSCPGCLNRCIQCKNIGLEGNIFNGFDDLANLIGSSSDLIHGQHHLLHLLLAVMQFLLGLLRLLTGNLSLVRIGLHLSGDIDHGSRQLLYRTGLLRGALGKALSPLGNPLRAFRYLHGYGCYVLGKLQKL